jgi:hypothetical protein
MMISRGIPLSALCLLLFSYAITGQTLTNLKASFDGEKMVVTYDLNYSDPNQKFKVNFYSSHDNYGRALSLISGDAGESVSPGQGNRVVWDVKNTLPADFEADIRIKIKASRAGGAAKLATKPLEKTSYKAGQSVTLQWAGGTPGGKVNIGLYKGDERQMQVADGVSNSGEFKWLVPKKGVKGKGYTLRVSSAGNDVDLSNTQAFAVKPKVPLYLIIIPVAALAVGGAAIALSGGGDPPPPPADEDLPGPVKPN